MGFVLLGFATKTCNIWKGKTGLLVVSKCWKFMRNFTTFSMYFSGMLRMDFEMLGFSIKTYRIGEECVKGFHYTTILSIKSIVNLTLP